MHNLYRIFLILIMAGSTGCATYTARISPEKDKLREHYKAEGIYPALKIDWANGHSYFEGADGYGTMVATMLYLTNIGISLVTDTLYLNSDIKAKRAREAERLASAAEVGP